MSFLICLDLIIVNKKMTDEQKELDKQITIWN